MSSYIVGVAVGSIPKSICSTCFRLKSSKLNESSVLRLLSYFVKAAFGSITKSICSTYFLGIIYESVVQIVALYCKCDQMEKNLETHAEENDRRAKINHRVGDFNSPCNVIFQG